MKRLVVTLMCLGVLAPGAALLRAQGGRTVENPGGGMVMTVLEAAVAAEKRPALEAAYRSATAAGLPPGLERTFLVQSTDEPATWRIISVWQSRDALARMRNSAETPAGVMIFRAAGAEPRLTVYDVVAHAPR